MLSEVSGENRQVATELRISGTIYLAHAARADRGGNPVVGERAAEHIEPLSVGPLSAAAVFLERCGATSTPRAFSRLRPRRGCTRRKQAPTPAILGSQ